MRFDRIRAAIRRAYDSGRTSVQAARVQARATEPTGQPDGPDEPTPASESTDTTERLPETSTTASRDDAAVPEGLRVAAAWAWRILILGVLGYFVLRGVALLNHVIVPLAVSLLLSALLTPAVGWLRRAKLPPSLATAVVVVAGLAAVIGTLTIVVNQFVNELPNLTRSARDGIGEIQGWLETGPLHLSDKQLKSALDASEAWITQNRETLTTGALAGATGLFDFLVGVFLVLFSTFFFLRDGQRIFRAIVSVMPQGARAAITSAGDASWGTLVAYVRATVLVAFIDAVGIGMACWILKVPFPFALAALVFLAAFIPIVGATLSGAVAVLVALVDRGPVVALILLGVVIAVQQLEGHVLQPIIMGRAVAIHPLAVILAIAAGIVLAGIIGALIAVPIVAVLNTAIRRLVSHRREPPPDAVIVSART